MHVKELKTKLQTAAVIRMALAAVLAAALLPALAGCTPRAARGLPEEALNGAIGEALGDPNTCVLMADRASGQVVYRYGAASTCSMAWPACDGPGTLQAADALRLATPQGRLKSCDSAPGRRVGWAAGQAPGTRALNYSAVMEGERALPGIEIQARLEGAFRRAGL